MTSKIERQIIGAILEGHEAACRASFNTEGIKVLEHIAAEIASALERGNKILLCGNGGSAADSQHIAAEFIGRFKKERRSLPALALTADTSVLTALSNDY